MTQMLQESLTKDVCSWDSNIKGQHLEYKMLHLQHLFLCVGIVCDIYKLSNLWWVDLFIFTEKKWQLLVLTATLLLSVCSGQKLK